jgi:acyl carrier protein
MSTSRERIEHVVLGAIRQANLARTPNAQLHASADAVIFGAGSPLDSLGLVALLIDIEEAFAADGMDISLSDSRAMSARQSPFRTVDSLVAHIESVLKEAR